MASKGCSVTNMNAGSASSSLFLAVVGIQFIGALPPPSVPESGSIAGFTIMCFKSMLHHTAAVVAPTCLNTPALEPQVYIYI